jgi:hypothetical protein
MFKHLPIKKTYLLPAAAIILLLLGYQLAFKNTLNALQVNQTLTEKLARSTSLAYQPEYVQRKNNNLSQLLELYKADTTQLRSNIINAVALIAENEHVILTGVPMEDVSFHTDHFIIEKLEFEGDFFSLLKLSNKLQASKGIGLVRSETFKKVIDRSHTDLVNRLVLEVYLEIYK